MEKKILLGLLVIVLLVTITGCGNKTDEESSSNGSTKTEEKTKNKVLSCSGYLDGNKNIYIVDSFIYDLDGKNLLKTTIDYSLEVDEDEIENTSVNCGNNRITFSYNHTTFDVMGSFRKCDSGVDGNRFYATLEIDLDDLEEEGLDKKASIDELKETLESSEGFKDEGITCKIEEK